MVGTFKYFECEGTVYTTRASLVTKLTDLFPPGEQSVLQEKLQVAVMNCLDANGNFLVSTFLDIVEKVELVTETPLEHSSPSNSGDEEDTAHSASSTRPIPHRSFYTQLECSQLAEALVWLHDTHKLVQQSFHNDRIKLYTSTLLELGMFGREGLKVLHSTTNNKHQILYLCW